MCDDARPLEETGGANAFGAVDDLGRDGKVTRGYFFAEGADGAEGEDGAYAKMFEGGDVGAGRDGGGGDVVVSTVASDKGDACPRGECADGDG